MCEQEKPFNPRSRLNFTPLWDYLSNILPKLLQENLLTFPPIKDNPRASSRPWFYPNEFCKFHKKNGYYTNGWMKLKHESQDIIDDGLVSIGAPIVSSNQHLGIFNNLLPNHDQSISLYEQDLLPLIPYLLVELFNICFILDFSSLFIFYAIVSYHHPSPLLSYHQVYLWSYHLGSWY